MAYGLIGAYALYFILVGAHGNADKLLVFVEENGKAFLPWILAILVLRALYNVETLRPVVKPFIALACLTFALRNWNKLVLQLNDILPQGTQIPTTSGASKS